jgi:chromosome segregation ATPase
MSENPTETDLENRVKELERELASTSALKEDMQQELDSLSAGVKDKEDIVQHWKSESQRLRARVDALQETAVKATSVAQLIDDFDLSKRIFEAAYKTERKRVAELSVMLDKFRNMVTDHLTNVPDAKKPNKIIQLVRTLGSKLYQFTQFKEKDPWVDLLPVPALHKEIKKIIRKAEELGVDVPASFSTREVMYYNTISDKTLHRLTREKKRTDPGPSYTVPKKD